jgi:hypothetical protein
MLRAVMLRCNILSLANFLRNLPNVLHSEELRSSKEALEGGFGLPMVRGSRRLSRQIG